MLQLLLAWYFQCDGYIHAGCPYIHDYDPKNGHMRDYDKTGIDLGVHIQAFIIRTIVSRMW
jgi:hypothetical protein